MRHIITEFQKIALAHSDIRFSLQHNEDEIYNLIPGNSRQRIIGLFGKQINNDLISLETATNLINIRGFIGKPENARRTYGEQFFFVNNRFMKHPYFHKAVVEAYQNILPAESFPAYFIFMETDPASIDINIHPTKTEIKFDDERSIWQILMASVREALGRFNIVPSIDFDNEMLVDIPVKTSSRLIPDPPYIEVDNQYNPFAGEETTDTKQRIIERFERENPANWDKLYPPPPGERSESGLPDQGRKFFQIKNKYIVCPVKSGLMLIDQKRAHERILFEKYLEIAGSDLRVSQVELFPVEIELNPADFFILKEIETDLLKLGFQFEHKGPYTISIKGIPSADFENDPATLFEILLEEYKNTLTDPATGVRERVAAAMASATAIPYGRIMLRNEMEDLFDTLFACKAPNYSPKGKPVINILTLEEIDQRLR